MAEDHLTKKERKELRKQEQEAERHAAADAKRAKTKQTIMIVVFSAVVVVAFIFWLIQNAPEKPELFDATPDQINPITETDNVKGATTDAATFTLIEYSDFQCPACGAYYPIVKKVVEDYGDQVQFVYRHLPIRQIHPNAELAARYAEAAGNQGKFFAMHDLLFEGQQVWSPLSSSAARKTFEEYATALELDLEQLALDADSVEVREKIENQRIDAVGAGANSTPTFFANGERLASNPQSYDEFVALITGVALEETPEPETSAVDVQAIQEAIEKSRALDETE